MPCYGCKKGLIGLYKHGGLIIINYILVNGIRRRTVQMSFCIIQRVCTKIQSLFAFLVRAFALYLFEHFLGRGLFLEVLYFVYKLGLLGVLKLA